MAATKTIKITGHPNTAAAAELPEPVRAVLERYVPGDVPTVDEAVATTLIKAKLAEPLLQVELLRTYKSLNVGEVCGFGRREAETLIERGAARVHRPEQAQR